MNVYAVLVKCEETCEEATAGLLRDEAKAKAYSDFYATIRPHLRQQIRDNYTGEKVKLFVSGNHKKAAKVCCARNGEYDAVDKKHATDWRTADALTRTLQVDMRTASESTPDKLRTDTPTIKKKRKTEQRKNQDKYIKRKITAEKEAPRAHNDTLFLQIYSVQQLCQAQLTATASAQHGRMLAALFAKSIGSTQAEVDAIMASMSEVHNADPPPRRRRSFRNRTRAVTSRHLPQTPVARAVGARGGGGRCGRVRGSGRNSWARGWWCGGSLDYWYGLGLRRQ